MKIKELQKSPEKNFLDEKRGIQKKNTPIYINNVSGGGSAALRDGDPRESFFSFLGLDAYNARSKPSHNPSQLEPPASPSCVQPFGLPYWSGWRHMRLQAEVSKPIPLLFFFASLFCLLRYKGTVFRQNNYLCSMKNKIILLLLLFGAALLQGCRDIHENPNYPNAIINFTINLNQIDYYDLRVVSGYAYLTSDPQSTSRGLIVYRLSQDEFRAYDRLPPNNPDCRDANGNLTRLVVDFPFVLDNCNDIKYNIINGDLFEGDGIYPLIQYHTSFNGYELHIYN